MVEDRCFPHFISLKLISSCFFAHVRNKDLFFKNSLVTAGKANSVFETWIHYYWKFWFHVNIKTMIKEFSARFTSRFFTTRLGWQNIRSPISITPKLLNTSYLFSNTYQHKSRLKWAIQKMFRSHAHIF